MQIFIIVVASFIASGLTLFSGFGLGTLLMPVIALFFPVDIAIAITAIVHLMNNIFKLALLGNAADKEVIIKFGLPAVFSASLGALLLTWLTKLEPLLEYSIFDKNLQIMPVKLIVGLIIIIFVFLELSEKFSTLTIKRKFLPWGGLLSGFFGGLSGNQGALRSMFLLKLGLNKEQFIASGIVIAVMVDCTRLLIYGWDMTVSEKIVDWFLVVLATLSAFIGAYLGSKLIKKLTIRLIQVIVSSLLMLVGLGMIIGIL